MIRSKTRRLTSLLLVLAMMCCLMPMPAAATGENGILSIQEEQLTPESTSVTVELVQVPDSGILRVVQLDAGESYEESKLNSYSSLNFSLVANLHQGENRLSLTSAPVAGKYVLAVLRDSSGSEMVDHISAPIPVVENGGTETEKTPEEILANSTVRILQDGQERTAGFTENETSAQVRVSLDETVDHCTLTLFAYAGNTTFDPDASQNIRLWSGTVTDGYAAVCDFAKSLQVGYKVIASLNVPVTPDPDGGYFYRPSNSQALEVIDENGEGFPDYVYPDAVIVENTLEAGSTTLHISLTGDERLFAAATEGKVSLSVLVREYPDGASIDLDEGKDQETLYSNHNRVTEPIDNQEITLSRPLRAGYRVRAIVFWGQNTELFLPKGNDYEEVFHRPDDSVLVSGSAEVDPVTATIVGPVNSESPSVVVTLGGTVPEGALILLKSFDADAQPVQTGGTWVASCFNAKIGENTLMPQSGSLTAGQKLVAFVLSNGELLAQSQPEPVNKVQELSVALEGTLTSESQQATFQVTALDESITFLNGIKLEKITETGREQLSAQWAKTLVNGALTVTFDLTDISLTVGDRLGVTVVYNNAVSTFESESFPVLAPLGDNSLAIQEAEFPLDASSTTVTISGCEEFKGGLLILTIGPASETDADSRMQLASVRFTGSGTYTLSFSSTALKAGQTVLPHLYRYDVDADATFYKYGEAVPITPGSQSVAASVEIVTTPITADRTDLWLISNFTPGLTGTVTLYTYDGTFDPATATQIYHAQVNPSENSQRVTFGSGKLVARANLIAVLTVSDGSESRSPEKVVTAAPEKQKPTAAITDPVVTQGDTMLNLSLSFDPKADNAHYTLYQFTGETLDRETATALSSASIYRNGKQTVYNLKDKLILGAKLQVVLVVDGVEGLSNIVTVEPSPDWGIPTAAFEVTTVQSNAAGIPVAIRYDEAYLTLGEEFYCDVSIYQFSGRYSDEAFEDQELWEHPSIATRIGQINSTTGDQTLGTVVVPVRAGTVLNPGDRLIIKLRLPHTEWEGEEVDYISASVPVVEAGAQAPVSKVLLYNLDEDSARGYRLRQLLDGLSIPYDAITNDQLNHSVGYLAELDGYEASQEPYTGAGSSEEFMLLCNLPEAQLDRFLDAMTADGLRIDHKAVVTAYNQDWPFHQLIDDIAEEHTVFQALLSLDELVKQAKALSQAEYGASASWEELQSAIDAAEQVIATYEPSLDSLTGANESLRLAYLSVTDMVEITGEVIITPTVQEDGTYTLTASVEDGSALSYLYQWKNGQVGPIVENIPASALMGTTVTVTAPNALGKLTAQLRFPDAPKIEGSAGQNNLTLRWTASQTEDNRPAPSQYRIDLYQGNDLIQSTSADTVAGTLTLNGLTAGTAYTVKVFAVSPVGRSDAALLTLSTTRPSSSGSGGGTSLPSVEQNLQEQPIPLGQSFPFADVSEDAWYYEAVRYLYDHALAAGISETSFAPNARLTRGMMAALLYRWAGSPEVGAPEDPWYAAPVAWAAEKGIVSGYGNGSYGENDYITREQLVTLLYRYSGNSVAPASDALEPFADGEQVSSWAEEAMTWAIEAEIIQGKENGLLDPAGTASRAEIAVIIYRMILQDTNIRQ